MTPRDRMRTALRNETPDCVPTFLCYHGMYVNRHTTLEYLLEYRRRMAGTDRRVVDAEEDLEIRRWAIEQTLDLYIGRVDFCFIFPTIRPLETPVITTALIEEAIRYIDADDGPLREMRERPSEPVSSPYWSETGALTTIADVDRYFEPADDAPAVPAPSPDPDPYADLRERHAQANSDLFACGSFTTPFCHAIDAFGYEGTMLAMHDRPAVFGYFIERLTAQKMAAIEASQTDGFWFDEYYTDVISPAHYDEFVWRPNVRLAQAVRRSGALSMYYFCGDIMPRLERILELEVDAVACEESKKWFQIDIAKVREVVGSRRALVGNMDGLHLLPRGTAAQIVAEVRRQLDTAARDGGFVMGAGSPIAPDTPLEHMRAFLDATRELGRYPFSWA